MKTYSHTQTAVLGCAGLAATMVFGLPAFAQDPAPVAAPATVPASTETKEYPNEGTYISIGGGSGKRGRAVEKDGGAFTEYDDGTTFNAAIGLRKKNFRIEGEYYTITNDINRASVVGFFDESTTSGDVKAQAIMLNAYYDFKIGKLRPFVGAGFGWYKSRISDLSTPTLEDNFLAPVEGRSHRAFATQYKIGVGYEITKKATLSVLYRDFDGRRLTFDETSIGPIQPSLPYLRSVEVALRYDF